MKRFEDRLMKKVGPTTLEDSHLDEITSESNSLLDKENLWKETRSRVWTRIKRFPHRPLKDGVVMQIEYPCNTFSHKIEE
jgi:hypothetical protein